MVALAAPVWWQDTSLNDLAKEIELLDAKIASARLEAASYGEGVIREVANLRIQTLEVTRALLGERQVATETGAAFVAVSRMTVPDLDRADELLQEIVKQRDVIAASEAELKNAGSGLTGALVATRVEAEKLTLTRLRLGYLASRLGLVVTGALESANLFWPTQRRNATHPRPHQPAHRFGQIRTIPTSTMTRLSFLSFMIQATPL